MKKTFFALAFMLIGSFAFANSSTINFSSEIKNESFAKINLISYSNFVVDIEEEGWLCDKLAKLARNYLKKATKLRKETLDKVEKALAALCDELL